MSRLNDTLLFDLLLLYLNKIPKLFSRKILDI